MIRQIISEEFRKYADQQRAREARVTRTLCLIWAGMAAVAVAACLSLIGG